MHAFDRQTDRQLTDGQTTFLSLDRVACNACSAIKIELFRNVDDCILHFITWAVANNLQPNNANGEKMKH